MEMNIQISLVLASLSMIAVSLLGGLSYFIPEALIKKSLLTVVAFSAGSLIGGAFFHLLPEALEEMDSLLLPFIWLMLGFCTFMVLEQFLQWHHCHKPAHSHHKPLTYMVLVSDTLHNILGGMAVAGSFLIDVRVGWFTWFAAIMHELPQELGDFGVLLHGGWTRKKALLFNMFSAFGFPVGCMFVYFSSDALNWTFLLPFTAGNFLYIGAVDLIPEINKHESIRHNVIHFISFLSGLLFLLAFKVFFEAG
ncbi:MAG: ZIP family metal transporter [Bdellovibrionales bacterium]|nr:ZIP family metal transporter [Bdellovibrionales bacterium]